ncbi:hypothetical protein QE152_g37860 [Popillia japonica]|uniref:HTH psq-type domain-containing protein n=1 Tax=Popillia japonica TaxID=7064 RepID=A0AAW1I9J4_POPJA
MTSATKRRVLQSDQEDMRKDEDAARRHDLSREAASVRYNAPRTTLLSKINGKYPEACRMDPKTNLTSEKDNYKRTVI